VKRLVMGLFTGAFALVLATAAHASTYYGFQIGITNAPPPPVIAVPAEPHCVLASQSMVYVVDDDAWRSRGDCFRYGQYWFVYSNNYWYRGRGARGPFTVIDVRRVPRAVLYVPRKHWKHHPYGPVVAKNTVVVVDKHPGHGNGHGNGNGRGHDRDD
jgi:hypothetical protein